MFTDEQRTIIEAVKNSDGSKVIGVNAVAGSGKSTTAKGVIDTLQPKNCLYTAFNKSVIDEAKAKFKNVDCRTLHSLAYKYLNYRNIEELTVSSLADFNLSFTDKKLIVTKLNDFFVSKYLSYKDFCSANHYKVYKAEVEVLEKLSQKKLPVPFNFLLKAFHLALSKDEIIYPEYDLVILDECQDTSAVALEIFMLLKAKKRVMLGDTHQNIYSFMNTVNAFTELNSDQIELYNLTQSFRCSPEIAKEVDKFGKKYFNDNFVFRGTDNPPERDGSVAILTRTNGALLEVIQIALDNDNDFKLFRNPYEIADMAIALKLISIGRDDKLNAQQVTRYRYLIELYNEYVKQEKDNITPVKFFTYIAKATDYDIEVISCVKFLHRCHVNGVDLFQLVKDAYKKNNPKSLNYISTVHTFKGLEADTVYIHDSLDQSIKGVEEGDIEPYNIYYVALSRARYKLDSF